MRCVSRRDEAAFPEGVTSSAQYGSRIKAAAVYLNAQQLIPEDRIKNAMAFWFFLMGASARSACVAEVMGDLSGASSLCPASIVAWGTKKAGELRTFVECIAAQIAAAAVRHLDETGFRIGGKTQERTFIVSGKRSLIPFSPILARRPRFPVIFR